MVRFRYGRSKPQNSQQWALTDFGLECTEEAIEYEIPKAHIGEILKAGDRFYYTWPTQLAEKTWVDIEAFLASFRTALVQYSQTAPVDHDGHVLSDSVHLARKTNAALWSD